MVCNELIKTKAPVNAFGTRSVFGAIFPNSDPHWIPTGRGPVFAGRIVSVGKQ